MADRVGLFGGTFDPVHNGHLAIARAFLKSNFIDQLWILPAPSPPHKAGQSITPFDHRKKMLELAFKGFDDILISDIENRLSSPSYTVKTLDYLKKQYPGKKFYLCIGEDSLVNFESWYKPDEILKECELLVAERPDFDDSSFIEKMDVNVHYVDHQPVNISSTHLRASMQKGEDVKEYIPAGVLEYIQHEGLYRNQQSED